MSLKDHLNKIEYFCAIVEAKSIQKASFVAGVTQPQLSRTVKTLEDDLGKQLLVRTPAGVELTKEGLELFKASQTIIAQVRDVERQIKFGDPDLEGRVRIGAYDSIARYFFPTFLKYAEATLPLLDIQLETSRSTEIYNKVKHGKLDIGICVEQNKFNSKQVSKEDIYSDSFGFYHHPAISTHFIEQLIIFPESLRPQLEDKSNIAKIYKFRKEIRSDNLETVKSLSEEAVGVGLLPHRVAREAVLQGKLIHLKRVSIHGEFHPHKIILCKNVGDSKPMLSSLVLELSRFLLSWSKS